LLDDPPDVSCKKTRASTRWTVRCCLVNSRLGVRVPRQLPKPQVTALPNESPSMGLLRRPTPGEIMEGGRFSRPCGPGAHSRAILENQLTAVPGGLAVAGRGLDVPSVRRTGRARDAEVVESEQVAGVGLAVKGGFVEPGPGAGDEQRGKLRSAEGAGCWLIDGQAQRGQQRSVGAVALDRAAAPQRYPDPPLPGRR
jgi:hypothetical protein